MKEIVRGIWTWSVHNEEKGLDFNGHFIVGPDDTVLIDPPPMTDAQMARVESLGIPSVILITNCHHTRDAMTFAARWRARILLDELDASSIPATVRLGGVYRDGDLLTGGLQAVRLQHQKSPGESALLCRAADAIILGDALIGRPAGRFGMLPDSKYRDAGLAREGLRRLLEHPFEAVLVGDGASLPAGGRRAVEQFLG